MWCYGAFVVWFRAWGWCWVVVCVVGCAGVGKWCVVDVCVFALFGLFYVLGVVVVVCVLLCRRVALRYVALSCCVVCLSAYVLSRCVMRVLRYVLVLCMCRGARLLVWLVVPFVGGGVDWVVVLCGLVRCVVC